MTEPAHLRCAAYVAATPSGPALENRFDFVFDKHAEQIARRIVRDKRFHQILGKSAGEYLVVTNAIIMTEDEYLQLKGKP